MENSTIGVDKVPGIGKNSSGQPSSAASDFTPLNKVIYKATKLWKEAVETFRKGVQLGKHRVMFRQYDQCFVAQDAVTWFHLELHQKFDTDITRQQTVHLLQKLYKAGVFVEVTNQLSSVHASKPLTAIKETDFKDNKRLYRLVEYNQDEVTAESTDSKSRDAKPNYYVVIKSLSREQVEEIWENVFIERFVQVVGYDVYTSFLKPRAVHGFRIMHNMTRISANGIVLAPTPFDELPTWVMNAMKCMAQGAASTEFPYTEYPAFENDVFGLINDYFNSFKKNAPLLTFELHDAFITTFIRAALFNGSSAPNKSASTHVRVVAPRSSYVQEKYPFNTSESTENLLLDMFTPSPMKEAVYSCHRLFVERKINPRRILAVIPRNSPVVVNLEAMEEKSYDVSRYRQMVTTAHVHATPEPVFLETAFTSERSPITRVISKAEIECSLGALRKASTSSVAPVNFAYENPLLELSPADLVNHPKYSRILRANTELNTNTESKVSSNASFEASLQAKAPAGSGGTGKAEEELTRSLDQQLRISSRPPLPVTGQRPFRSQSAANLSDANQDRSFVAAPPLPPRSRGSIDMADQGFPQFLLKKYSNSPSKSAQKTMKMLSGSNLKMSLMSPEGKHFAIVAFRLLTLLLPSQNRRYLHLLLQFMAKMAEKDKLMLDVANTTRAIVVNEFSRAILGCFVEKEYDQYLAHQIVSFLMDNNQEVFDVVKEEALQKAAEDQIREQRIEKVPMSATKTKVLETTAGEDKENSVAPPKSSCLQFSLDEYDDQRLLATTAPELRNLLAACDALTDPKERKRQLEKFRENYPHIYAEKYGDRENAGTESSTEIEATPEPKKSSSRILRALF